MFDGSRRMFIDDEAWSSCRRWCRDCAEKRSALYYSEITFTNVGWFHPDPKIGLQHSRSLVGADFMKAVLSHERFNASAWKDLHAHPDPSRPILVFLDVDVCNTWHWPVFGNSPLGASDVDGGRKPLESWVQCFRNVCTDIETVLKSPAMSAEESRLVVVTCQDSAQDAQHFLNCTKGNRDEAIYGKLVVGHMSSHKDFAHPHDFGMPPWPVKTASLDRKQIMDIEKCRPNSRAHLLSFVGRPRVGFDEFQKYFESLHEKDGVHVKFGFTHYEKARNNRTEETGNAVLVPLASGEQQRQDEYYRSLMDSYFVPTPRGDNLFSVRFSEVLSAGAIPIVYSNGWVLPYNKEVVDWSELAILLPQERVSETLTILKSIPRKEMCKGQQKVLSFFNEYASDSHGRLRAILIIMDARLNRKSDADITTFSAAPGI